MAQPKLTLFHSPGACSQVTVCALEMAGLTYDLNLVNIAANAQSAPDYLAISPLGKVPLMLIDGVALSENSALLTYIDGLRPDAGIFPVSTDPLLRAETMGGLSFCSGTLHPQIRGIANPQRLTTGDIEPVREKSRALAIKSFGFAEGRLNDRSWWLGERSIIDVYLNWAFTVARTAGFDVTPFPRLSALAERLMEVPAFARMQAIDREARIALGLPE